MTDAKTLLFGMLVFAGCTSDHRSMIMEISERPARTVAESGLDVPAECPIYTPTGSDINTPELPFPVPLLFGCGIDDGGATYGIVTGDTGDLAVLQGSHELGVYVAFDSTLRNNPLTAASLELDGPAPAIKAWSAPVDVASPTDCCAESHPDAQIPLTVVAIGAPGVLLSLGQFGTEPTQVAIVWDLHALLPDRYPGSAGYGQRFYVNSAPY